MKQYRIEIAFYVEAETHEDAQIQVEDGMSAQLASNYDFVDWCEA